MFKMYARRQDPNQPNSRGIPFGVVVGIPLDGGVAIGWSQCSNQDHFDKNLGTRIAMGRLETAPCDGDMALDGYGDPVWKPEMVDTINRVVEEIHQNPDRYVEIPVV